MKHKSALTYDEGAMAAREVSLYLASDDLNSTRIERKDSRAGGEYIKSPGMKVDTTMYAESLPANESEFQEVTTPVLASLVEDAE